MDKKTRNIIIVSSILIVGIICWAITYIVKQQETIEIMSEQFALDKEDLENEYSQLAIQYEGYKLSVNNDSLEQKLEDQRIKIQRLVEELKQTKVQDAKRNAQHKKELETVRGVLRYYVAQVDSLNRGNEALVAENKEVRQQMRTVQNTNENLQQRNQQLTKTVKLAAQLNVTNLVAHGINKRKKPTPSLKQTAYFEVSFTVAANVTAQIGEKDFYVRILKPNDDLLTNAKSGTFSYEGSSIEYSMKKREDYGGEEMGITLYWTRNETLDPGTYTFEVYADGNLIGTTRCKMEK